MSNKSNVGQRNVGDCNVGDCNVGDWNVGDGNIGDWNVGNGNVGQRNVGQRNVGYRNVGNWNVGDCNVGSWNVCDQETGFFNTIQDDKIRVFNKEVLLKEWEECDRPSFIYFDLTEWIYPSDMTDREKEDNKTHKTTGGYLKKYEYKEAFQKSWDEASEEDRKKIFNIPNFDAEVFKEISGIDVNQGSERNNKIKELEEQARYIAEELKKLK